MMALRHGGNTVVRRICPPPPNSLPDENSLRLLAITQTLASILNVAVDNSVLVGALYETCSLSGQDSLGTFGRRVNETDDLEPRTELVFQSERVAAGGIHYYFTSDVGGEIWSTYFHGPSSLPNMMFCWTMLK